MAEWLEKTGRVHWDIRRFSPKPFSSIFPTKLPLCYPAGPLVSPGTSYASSHTFLHDVVFRPVKYGWGSTGCPIPDGSYCRKQAYALYTGGTPNGTGSKSLTEDWFPSFPETIRLWRNLSVEQRGVLLGLAFEYQEFSFPALEAWVGMEVCNGRDGWRLLTNGEGIFETSLRCGLGFWEVKHQTLMGGDFDTCGCRMNMIRTGEFVIKEAWKGY